MYAMMICCIAASVLLIHGVIKVNGKLIQYAVLHIVVDRLIVKVLVTDCDG